jgi:hypothetical protein
MSGEKAFGRSRYPCHNIELAVSLPNEGRYVEDTGSSADLHGDRHV